MNDYTVQLGSNRKYVETKVHIRVTEKLALESQTKANKLAAQHNLKRFLVDVRGISTQTGAVGDITVAEELRKTGLPLSSKIAILASSNDRQHDFIETASYNRGIILRVFKDDKTAKAWLSQ